MLDHWFLWRLLTAWIWNLKSSYGLLCHFLNEYPFCTFDISTKMKNMFYTWCLFSFLQMASNDSPRRPAICLYTPRSNRTKLNTVRLQMSDAVISTCYQLTPEILHSITKKLQKLCTLIFARYLSLSPLYDKWTAGELYNDQLLHSCRRKWLRYLNVLLGLNKFRV